MQLLFSDKALPSFVGNSLFLGGPSPRDGQERDWRHEALRLLAEKRFEGTAVLPVPEALFYRTCTTGANEQAEVLEFRKPRSDGTVVLPVPEAVFYPTGATEESWTYDNQIEWGCAAREQADVLVFWVPRSIDRNKADLGMPGFTTNFELGEDLPTGKVVYGRPPEAVKCRYLDKRVEMYGDTVYSDLSTVLDAALAKLAIKYQRNAQNTANIEQRVAASRAGLADGSNRQFTTEEWVQIRAVKQASLERNRIAGGADALEQATAKIAELEAELQRLQALHRGEVL